MVIKEIEDLKATIKLLEVKINSLSGIAEDVDIDACYKALQNLVFQVQYKANAIGEGVAPLIRHKKATFNSQGIDYVKSLLVEEPEPEPEKKPELEDKPEESEKKLTKILKQLKKTPHKMLLILPKKINRTNQ